MERFASSSLREVEGYGVDQGDHGITVVRGRSLPMILKENHLPLRSARWRGLPHLRCAKLRGMEQIKATTELLLLRAGTLSG